MDEPAARVQDVRHVAFAFLGPWGHQRLAQGPEQDAGVVEVEEEGSEGVGTHRPDSVGDDEPALGCLQRGRAPAELDEVPGPAGVEHRDRVPPVQGVGRARHTDGLTVPARQAPEAAPDVAGEQCHSLVLRGRADLRSHREGLEVVGDQQVRRDGGAVEGGVGRVVAGAPVRTGETHQASVLDPVALRDGAREDDPRRQLARGGEGQLVAAGSHSADALEEPVVAESPVVVELRGGEHVLELLRGELLRQPGQDALCPDRVPVLVQRVVQEAGRHRRLRHPTGGQPGPHLVEPDDIVGGQRPRAELQAGDVALADGPGGHDESQLAAVESALVRVRGDGGVQQCRCLDGVLVRQVRADELRTVRGDGRGVGDPVGHELVVLQEGRPEVQVPVGVGGEGRGEGPHDIRLGHLDETFHDGVGARDPLAR